MSRFSTRVVVTRPLIFGVGGGGSGGTRGGAPLLQSLRYLGPALELQQSQPPYAMKRATSAALSSSSIAPLASAGLLLPEPMKATAAAAVRVRVVDAGGGAIALTAAAPSFVAAAVFPTIMMGGGSGGGVSGGSGGGEGGGGLFSDG